MLELHCLAIIVYMETRNQPELTQTHVASFAIEQAQQSKVSLCKHLNAPKIYTWQWDGVSTKIDHNLLETKIKPVALKELKRKTRTLSGYKHFNNCSGTKFPGKVFKSNDICFYTGGKRISK